MPYIDCKITKKLSEEQIQNVKTHLGKAVSLIGKPESYLMVGIDDGYCLFFAGKEVEDGAFVGVSLFGNSTPDRYEKMTAEICRILERETGADPARIYVTYQGIGDWGWNGSNF